VPLYTFELRDGSHRVQDTVGAELQDHAVAHDYAREVAWELMSGRERETRAWCLEVHEDGAPVLAIPFASVDPTLDHLERERRQVIEKWYDCRRSLQEAVTTARKTVRESRAAVARSRGRPYLAAANGERTIR
jgi:hypothetical protein